MILLLCGLIALAVIGVILMYAATETRSAGLEFLAITGGCASMLAVVVGLIAYCALVIDYVGADYKKDVINREYGTNYTQKEVFFASSVIDTVRELDRKRVEINGDILKK